MRSKPKAQMRHEKGQFGSAHLDPADAYAGVPILKVPVWKNEVAAYFFLGGVSAGSALFGSLVEVFGGPTMRRLAHTAHYVSFATFLPCPALLIDDLGVPSKFHHMLRIVKPSSPMNLGSWGFAVHGAGATITVLRMLAADNKLPLAGRVLRILPEDVLAALGIPSSLLLAGYTGVLLGTTSVPVWYTSKLLGALFMASSISTGTAAVEVAHVVTSGRAHEKSPVAVIRLVSDVATLAAFVAYIKSSGPAGRSLWKAGNGFLNKASLASLALAIVGGSIGAEQRTKRAARLTAAAAALAGGALLRWGIVGAGRTSSQDREETIEAMRSTPERPGWVPKGEVS